MVFLKFLLGMSRKSRIRGTYTNFAKAIKIPRSRKKTKLFVERISFLFEQNNVKAMKTKARALVTTSALIEEFVKTDIGKRASNVISHLCIGIILIEKKPHLVQINRVISLVK